jgi:hypothetical protein
LATRDIEEIRPPVGPLCRIDPVLLGRPLPHADGVASYLNFISEHSPVGRRVIPGVIGSPGHGYRR